MMTVLRRVAFLAAGLCLLATVPWSCPASKQAASAGGATAERKEGVAGARPVDEFHPQRDVAVEPAFGGTVVVLLESLPKSLCYPIEPSGVTRNMLREVHETLVVQDWEHWDYRPCLAQRWDIEDTVVLTGGRGADNANVYWGKVTEEGEEYVVTPVSGANPHGVVRVAKSAVESIERGTVFTFYIKPGIKWHDGKTLDARDAWFSWDIYRNDHVDCDSFRPYFSQIVHADVVDDLTIRFFYEKQYFQAIGNFSDFMILPRHVYDLSDPENPAHDPRASLEKQADHINKNPHNTLWIGLGPYRVTEFTQGTVTAVRFPEYFDDSQAGYFDEIRWRHISSDTAGFQALINGELDFFYRITADDYVGDATAAKQFTNRCYKGYFYTGQYNYSPWNMRRPILADVRVRKALNMCYDWDEHIDAVEHGLAVRVTGPQFRFGPSYNASVQPLPFDLEQAEALLAEAGWYDRDGDAVIDKDGVPFRLEFLMTPGNKASEVFIQKYQENLGKVGIQIEIVTQEWASLLDRVLNKDYDFVNMSWSVPLESDPKQLWHSDGASLEARGSNHASVNDPYIDDLIVRGRRELDDDKRFELWHDLHRYIYEELHPYMFGLNKPRKFGMNQAIRGFQSFSITPGYSIRRWYYPQGHPGTRSTLH